MEERKNKLQDKDHTSKTQILQYNTKEHNQADALAAVISERGCPRHSDKKNFFKSFKKYIEKLVISNFLYREGDT